MGSEKNSFYEYIDGGQIMPQLADKGLVPIPPEWVRTRVAYPNKYQYATLAKEVDYIYPARVRETLVKCVRDWPTIRRMDTQILVTGRGSHKRRRWAAAALVNELMLRYAPLTAFTVETLAASRSLPALTELRGKDPHSFWAIRKRLINASLLVVEEPLRLKPSYEDRWFLEGLYLDRGSRPTLTTLATDVSTDEGWGAVEAIMGEEVVELFQDANRGYIATY